MSRKKLVILIVIVLALFLSLYLSYLTKDRHEIQLATLKSSDNRILVVASLFPWYDLAQEIGGERVQTVLLLSPGLDAHSFEPRPQDILMINQADLFLYTSKEMEPWAQDLASALNSLNKSLAMTEVLDLGDQTNFTDENDLVSSDDNHDPHIWLDPIIMGKLARELKPVLSQLDPEGESIYQSNLLKYLARLDQLDRDYRETLNNCESRQVIFAGHSAFAYLARRYQLDYISASGFSPNAESTPNRLVVLSDLLRKNKAKYLFSDSLENKQLAEALAKNMGLEILSLKTGANLSKTDFASQLSYEDIMRYNLSQLSQGLTCQK